MNYGNKFCHPAHDDEQQQQQQQQYSNTLPGTQQQAGTYEYILVRRASAYSIIIIIDQIQEICGETAQGAYVTKIQKKGNNNAQSSSSASSTMYVLRI